MKEVNRLVGRDESVDCQGNCSNKIETVVSPLPLCANHNPYMEGHGFPKTSGGLRSTAMVRLAERARQLWDQITTRESAYQPYQEEVDEEEQRKKDKSDPVLPQYQGGKKNPKKGEVVISRVEAALSDSRTFVITLSCRLS